jgi:hypothetical protein
MEVRDNKKIAIFTFGTAHKLFEVFTIASMLSIMTASSPTSASLSLLVILLFRIWVYFFICVQDITIY